MAECPTFVMGLVYRTRAVGGLGVKGEQSVTGINEESSPFRQGGIVDGEHGRQQVVTDVCARAARAPMPVVPRRHPTP